MSDVTLARFAARLTALAAIIAPLGASHAAAQQALDEIVITANRTPSEINKVGSTVEVVDREELDKHNDTFLKDYLARLPGVTFAQNGPPGSTGTIQIRGALSQYVKVIVDGIDISDVAAPQAATSFEHLMVGDIERIEVVKGPQSTLYGSEAVGGIISVTTRPSARGLSTRSNVEFGSYSTKRFSANVSYGSERGDISFTAQGLETDGFSAADENAGNTERDGYENLTFSGRAQYRINDSLRVFFAARSTDAESQLDAFSFITNGPADALGESSTFSLQAARAGAEVSLFDGRFVNTFSLQRTSIERENFGAFPGLFESERTKYEYKGVARFSPMLSLVVGADFDDISAAGSGFEGRAGTETIGTFAQALIEPIENVNLTAGIRRDDHSDFGTFDTYRLTGAWFIPASATKFRASYGTAFRAPSLFELFAPISFGVPQGNPNLQPETSRGWDAGIDQTLANGKARLSATYFSLDIENLVIYDFFSNPNYQNVAGTTRRHGVELSGQAELAPWLTTSASYTYTDTEDANGDRLVRVPAHVLTLGLDLKPHDRVTINATALHARDTLDVQFPGRVALDNYWLVNAKATFAVSDQLSLYVRGVNLLDDEYQTLAGFGTSDRAVYAGLTMKLTAPPSLEPTAK